MNVQKYIEDKMEFEELIIEFFSCDGDSIKDISKIEDYITKGNETLHNFLKLISIITENHHRSACFLNKIEQILAHFAQQIKQKFTNLEIFEIFKENKLVLLYLFEQEIITLEESMIPFINERSQKLFREPSEVATNDQFYQYDLYFYPEISKIVKNLKSWGFIKKIIINIYNIILICCIVAHV